MQQNVKFMQFLIVIVDVQILITVHLLRLQMFYLQEGASAFLSQNSLCTVYESSILVCMSLQAEETIK
jgi:hypothetical protein